MIGPITRAFTNPGLTTLVQNTNASVSLETTLKAIGRPGFILIDNDISNDTKKYAAAKEFLYQATCLAVYALLVVPVFKKGAFKLAKKGIIHKGSTEFEHFRNLKNYESYRKLASKTLDDRQHYLQLNKLQDKFTPEIQKILETEKEPDLFKRVKGTIEAGSLLGSVLGLAILAPQVSHAIIHPALRFVGLEKKKETVPETEKPLNNTV